MGSIFLSPTSNSVHHQLACPYPSHPPFHSRVSATRASHPNLQPHANAQEQRQQQGEHQEEEEDKEEGVQSTPSSGRRGLVTATLAAALIDCNSTRFIPSSNGTKHMSRALVQTGQEREMRMATNSAVAGLESRISAFSLDNGMRWIVLERHNAPVVACHTFANVGAALEADGCTGVAHLLVSAVFYSLQDAKQAGNSYKVGVLEKKFIELQAKAAALVIPNEYGALMARQGGIGLNAQTSQDSTEYFVSLPVNKLELWMALESGRFLAPVFRELYSEKEHIGHGDDKDLAESDGDSLVEDSWQLMDGDEMGKHRKMSVDEPVIKEERRLRIDNAAYGRFTETFLEMGFPGFPYRRPVIGYPSDFENIGRREVNQFFKENYTPEMLTCAVVGDVNAAEVESLARQYFGGWGLNRKNSNTQVPVVNQWHEAHEWDTVVRTNGQRFFSMKLPAQPFYMEGYYRPAASSNEDPVISIIDELLSGGRLCHFYRNLILEGKALSATSSDTYPGDQRPCLFLVYGVPAAGVEGKSLAGILHQQLELLASCETTQEELFRVKKASRASLLELFGSSGGMAKLLCKYEATTGSYKNLFTENELVEAVTPKDICRVAARLFHPDNRISGSVTSSRHRI